MSDAIATFFDAWQLEDSDTQLEKIRSVVTTNVQYTDPRTSQTVNGIEALAEYVGMFSANAPGWSAKVIKCDTTGTMYRATVVFGGTGPDGNEMVMHGQYFVETENELISRMVGFVGTGAPD